MQNRFLNFHTKISVGLIGEEENYHQEHYVCHREELHTDSDKASESIWETRWSIDVTLELVPCNSWSFLARLVATAWYATDETFLFNLVATYQRFLGLTQLLLFRCSHVHRNLAHTFDIFPHSVLNKPVE